MTTLANTPQLKKHFSLEFFEPGIALINLHENAPGLMHGFVPCLETLLLERLSPGSEYYLVFNPSPKRDDSFSFEDIESIHLHMESLSKSFSCHSTYFIMNEGLHYHINRAMAESYSTKGVFRSSSLSDAFQLIEENLGIEIVFDQLPVSCC